jgi:hypothetical protein
MRSRTGLEAEAINRLTEGVQPPVIRAILVQCLAGEVAPSATVSRASDMLVHDRVDELTQVFVENVVAHPFSQ